MPYEYHIIEPHSRLTNRNIEEVSGWINQCRWAEKDSYNSLKSHEI